MLTELKPTRITGRSLVSAGVCFVCFAGLLACGSFRPLGPPPTETQTRPWEQPKVEDLELKALLLLQVDRQLFEPFSVDRAFEGGVELRRYLATTLSRTGSRQAAAVLQALLLDNDSEVRQRAAFGLGALADTRSRRILLRTAKGDDTLAAMASVAALARLETPLLDVGEVLAELPEDELWRRLLPSLYRFEGEAVLPLALRAFGSPLGPELRFWATYALSRHAAPLARDRLRSLLEDEQAIVRAEAARGLGALAVPDDLPLLGPLLEDDDPAVILAVLQTVPARLAVGAAAAPESWKPALLQLFEDPRPGLRLAALGAAGEWLLDDQLGERLAKVAAEGREPFASAAALSLVEGRDPRALELMAHLAAAPSAYSRVRAVDGAAVLGLWDLIEELADDPEGEVRAKALRTLLQRRTRSSEGAATSMQDLLEKAAQDPDAGVRADLLEVLVEDPRISVEELAGLFVRTRFDRVVQSRINGVKALVARALAKPEEKALAVGILERLTSDREYLVRVQVAVGLRRLNAEAVPVGPASSGRVAEVYQGIVLQAARRPQVELRTRHGAMVLELNCPEAPLTCTNFLQLVEQGFYDGLKFHRVEPGFIAQGGDPRGDGWGGPGYTLRDELGPTPFEKGSLGMARSSPHSAGSQFFLALSRLPALDGAYTHLGRVIDGIGALDLLVEGDVIESAKVLY